MKDEMRSALLLWAFSIAGGICVLGQAPAAAAPATAAPVADAAASTPNPKAQRPITEAQLRKYMVESSLSDALHRHLQEQLDLARKQRMPWMPDSVWAEVVKNMAAADLVKAELPMYQRYFSEEDGDALPLMYQGPTGRAYATASMQADKAAQELALGSSPVHASVSANPARETMALREKREAELTPEQLAAWHKMQNHTELTTLQGLKLEEEESPILMNAVNNVMRVTLGAHKKELLAAQQAYQAKKSRAAKTPATKSETTVPTTH